jgi:hypothetical protein
MAKGDRLSSVLHSAYVVDVLLYAELRGGIYFEEENNSDTGKVAAQVLFSPCISGGPSFLGNRFKDKKEGSSRIKPALPYNP